MKKILIFTEYFEPGYKAGGPIKSIKNMVDSLKDQFNFTIITKNKDLGDEYSYSNIDSDIFYNREWGNILYTNLTKLNIIEIKRMINKIKPDYIYLNSFFSPLSVKVYLCKLLLGINPEIIIAPRGEFSPGALDIKKNKKRIFLSFFKLLPFNFKFHSTDKLETKHITNQFHNKKISLAPNLPDPYTNIDKLIIKNENELNLIFISRISQKKNLHFLNSIFENIKGKVNLDIFGPIENQEYFDETMKLLKCNENLKVNYKGHIENSKVSNTIRKYHYFILPTLGENYGHAIIESFLAKTPVIISDQTPWRNLKDLDIGFDIDLTNKEKWIESVNLCLSENQEKYNKKISAIEKFIVKLHSERNRNIELSKKIFQ